MISTPWHVLPADLAALYSEQPDPEQEQLAIPVETAEDEFRRWLDAQPCPDWMVSR